MAYDSNVTSSIINVDVKRRTWRVDFQRPQDANAAGDLMANGFIKEDIIHATPKSPTSGSIFTTQNWAITINKEQIQSINGYAQFMGGIVNLFNNLKTEYDSTGRLATGSISIIP